MTDEADQAKAREGYLLGGRRVTVADLMDAGLVTAGDKMHFDRPRLGEVHTVAVLNDGRLGLSNGPTFRSPSGAATAATGARAIDGWSAWRHDRSGKLLDELRQQLLDQSAEAGAGEDESSAGLHDRLKLARSEAEADRPVGVTVRELISWWGAKGRGQQVVQTVIAGLANHGLSSMPEFWKVGLDTHVTLDLPTDETRTSESAPPEPATIAQLPIVEDEDDADEALADGLTLGTLTSATSGVSSISPTATLSEAITQMMLDDYSQLAVMSGRTLKGAVTWKSIAEAMNHDAAPSLAVAMVRAPVLRYDTELASAIDILTEEQFVLVTGPAEAISGIVTASDVVALYGKMSTPFFLIGELDRLLRHVIRVFSFEEVQHVCDREALRLTSFADLTFGDYQQVFTNPDRWAQLGWQLDRGAFGRRLEEIRLVRNDLVHFNSDELSPEVVPKLRSMIRLVRMYARPGVLGAEVGP